MGTETELQGMHFEIELGSPGYPSILADIPDPPRRIYGIGDPAALQPGVAIIGARKATPYGITCTERFAAHIARRGLTIIAGGAIGCDLQAHKTALEMKVPTIVVFGSGADVVYPKRGLEVFQQAIDQGGAVISENPWGTPPQPAYFPQRNRIIAGLAVLLVIAEAGLPSGTFSTADAALAQGKEVAVVPGAITSPNSAGSNRLLCQGATPIVDADSLDDALQDAFERYPFPMAQPGPSSVQLPDAELLEQDELLKALSAQAYRPDELTAYFGISASELVSRLSQYEMQGLVERGRGGLYHARALVRK